VFGIGPAGTGKTYLAMAMAVNALKKNIVSRIILTRPAVEAGESLGYSPGDMYEKVSPYLRPLYDALLDMVEPNMVKDYMDKGLLVPDELLAKLALDRSAIAGKKIYRAKGCVRCRKTGYYGRTGLFELLEVKLPIRKLIFQGKDQDDIKFAAKKAGMMKGIRRPVPYRE
jgi:hypothetical protein